MYFLFTVIFFFGVWREKKMQINYKALFDHQKKMRKKFYFINLKFFYSFYSNSHKQRLSKIIFFAAAFVATHFSSSALQSWFQIGFYEFN